MKRYLAVLAFCCAALAPEGLSAQGVAGSWKLEFVRRVSNENGVETPEMGHARVVLEVKGDSVVASWQGLEPGPDGKTPEARQIRGTVQGNHVVLKTEAQARVMRNGELSVVPMTVTYDLTVEGDRIAGVQLADSPDLPMAPPARPIHGEREKAPAGS